jgi:serine/threonine protein kinase
MVDSSLMREACEQAFEGCSVTHLADGGFGSTFKVICDGEATAVKFFDPAAGSDRIARELAAIQRVDHPNVVGYRRLGELSLGGQQLRWLQMDFVEGVTLATEVASGRRFTLPEAVQILREAVAGAAAIWEQDTAHRDLSPNNLLLTPEGHVVIVDLGLARHLTDATITSLPTPGTPGWMSPEQVGADPEHGDYRSDQYVLGLLGWWLINGYRPFSARFAHDWWVAPAQQTVKAIRDVDPAIPAVVSEVISRMTSKQPYRRYLRPQALIEDLERAEAALAVHSTDETPACGFGLMISMYKSFASREFLADLGPEVVVVDPRYPATTSELMDFARAAGAVAVMDPVTHFARSTPAVRPAFLKHQPWGEQDAIGPFRDEESRRACVSAL